MRVILRHYPQEKPNGDLATTKTPCHRYDLMIERKGKEAVVADADDFNHWWSGIDESREEYRELYQRALKLADVMGVILEEVHMVEKVVERREWVEG